MKTETLTPAEAKTLYNESGNKGKSILEKKFGAEFFTTNIMDRVKNINDVIKLAHPEENELILLNYNGLNDRLLGAKNALLIMMLADVLNEGWEADYTNTSQKKWFPVWDLSSGFGFSYSYYDGWYSGTFVGSRLCFKSEALSDYAAKIAPEVYKTFITKNTK